MLQYKISLFGIEIMRIFGLLFLLLSLHGCGVFHEVKQKVIEHQVRDRLKTIDLKEYVPAEYTVAHITLKTQSQNQYPNFIITGTLPYRLNVTVPQFIQTEAKKYIETKSCDILNKLEKQEPDIQQATARVLLQDKVTFTMIIQDNQQHELMKHVQLVSECPNFTKFNPPEK